MTGYSREFSSEEVASTDVFYLFLYAFHPTGREAWALPRGCDRSGGCAALARLALTAGPLPTI
jgi:hypothetical protein